MFAVVVGEIEERVKQLEARLAQLELERDNLDARLASIRGSSQPNLNEKLKFFPISSKSDAEFFKELGERKLNLFKLSDEPVEILGAYSVTNGKEQDKSWLEVRASSFNVDSQKIDNFLYAHERKAAGMLLNVNTTEKFKELDKKKLLADTAKRLLDDIESGNVFKHPSTSLTRFLLLTFADLKKHKYLYWFGFPALGYSQSNEPILVEKSPLREALPGCFESLSNAHVNEDDEKSFFFFTESGEAKSLKEWPAYEQKTRVNVFGFIDPSPTSEHPGWFLRNFLLLLVHPKGMNLGGKRVRIVSIREIITPVPRQSEHSIVWTIDLPKFVESANNSFIGWEHNIQDKMGPRLVDLSELLDHKKLSDAACNLNLRLMKWRAFPELDDQRLAQSKVLLLGAGTLGCAVARGLMGWGFRNFTFCDSGKVSYSNPVRQSLYIASDCAGTGQWKAQVAAERCREIHPSVQTSFWVGNIPMPGHSGDPKAKADYEKLDELIKSHDVICLLTDTRESRWLPTVMGAAHDKIVLNAALGFDSYVVMRHGSRLDGFPDKLGCYFCSDVVAPKDSTKDRTLDQQCTVTRPGCAPIASALLVEMLVGILHHPQGNRARPGKEGSTSKLGMVPHQVRGYLGSFQNDVITGQAFPQCTGCSEVVLNEYLNNGFNFVTKVLEDPDWLEELTGLDALKKGQGTLDEDFALEDDDFGMDGEDEEEDF